MRRNDELPKMVEHRSSVDSSRAHCVAHMARTKQRVTCDHRAAVERAAARVRKAADIGSACLQPAGLLHAHCCRASKWRCSTCMLPGRSRHRDRYRSLTLDCCRPHHTIAHVWARLPGAAISRGTHSRPSRWHLLQASSKSAPHATLALWHARHAGFRGSLPSEGQSRPNRQQRALI